ncbi:epithelial-stromal interaction protein 1 isoform X3 [Oenanthe melanoleuca]|uniref:epithelial-stromal interaction protein 1 isoform X3 n=1 Tax=Oenanthe melanoleuca TaxID=2939378 RepID=UPI0024C11F63|nr:epithelial-stromal interaction protein 1 isoform X3 [Oenanthe melanoleuca]XP_056352057.1 epithelial-stromal interaction protein 1 isoform X3 [Oenanthe melanoleuca]
MQPEENSCSKLLRKSSMTWSNGRKNTGQGQLHWCHRDWVETNQRLKYDKTSKWFSCNLNTRKSMLLMPGLIDQCTTLSRAYVEMLLLFQENKREEYVKARKAAEEAEILKKKAIQREKAERLEVKKRQEEMQRREMLLEDQKYKTNELLNRLDVGLPKSDSCQIANPGPESTAWERSHAYKQALREDENRQLEEMKQEQRRKAELMAFKEKQEEETRTRELKNEQRRVNNAFLDRLQNKTQPDDIYHPGYTGLPQ